MIPVAKQSILLAAFGLSPIQALAFHIWAGRICLILTVIHGTLFILDFGFYGKEIGYGFIGGIRHYMIPRIHCFHSAGIMKYKEISEECQQDLPVSQL